MLVKTDFFSLLNVCSAMVKLVILPPVSAWPVLKETLLNSFRDAAIYARLKESCDIISYKLKIEMKKAEDYYLPENQGTILAHINSVR